MEGTSANADAAAQIDYDNSIALRRAFSNGRLELEVAANELLGVNALKKVLDQYGPWRAGFTDDLELSDHLRDRLAMHTYQETITAQAMARFAFVESRKLSNRLNLLIALAVILIAVSVAF